MPTRHLVDLAATAIRLADSTRLWESLVEYDPVSRYYARLALTREHEAWLLTWVPGQGTDWHDHGGSAGAFTVVRGALTEEHAVLRGEESAVVASSRELQTGTLRPFGTRHIHRVTNTGLEPAVSIHVYAPALTRMNGYVREGDQLRLVESRPRLDRLTPAQAYAAREHGAVVVDIRPAAQREVQGGPDGVLVIERNVLEWRFDPASDARLPIADDDLQVVVLCQEGFTSSLAAAALQDLGLHRATDVVGGWKAWRMDLGA